MPWHLISNLNHYQVLMRLADKTCPYRDDGTFDQGNSQDIRLMTLRILTLIFQADGTGSFIMLECKDEILAFFKKNLRKATDFIQKASEISTKVIDDVVRLVALLVMIIADNQDIVSLILQEKLDKPIVGLYMTLSKRTAKSAN